MNIWFYSIYKLVVEFLSKKLILVFILIPISISNIQAIPRSVEIYMDNPKQVGYGRLIYFMFGAYEAFLYAPDGVYTDNKPPHALTMRYMRDFTKKQLVHEAISEIRKQGYKNEEKLRRWEADLTCIIPDVVEDQSLTVIAMKNGETAFFSGVIGLGWIDDPEFAEIFFGIWLDPNTAEPLLRKQLLGIE